MGHPAFFRNYMSLQVSLLRSSVFYNQAGWLWTTAIYRLCLGPLKEVWGGQRRNN